jgi:hypothetical protein
MTQSTDGGEDVVYTIGDNPHRFSKLINATISIGEAR